MSASRSVSVSVVSHGHGPLLRALLEDLARLDSPHVAEVILTLNIPEAPGFSVPALPVPLRVIANPEPRGFGANHNAAFALAAAPRFAILNPDLRLDADPFGLLAQALDAPRVALVAPRIVDEAGAPAPSARRLYTPLEIVSRLWRHAGTLDEPEWLAGMFLMARADAFAEVGGFDERYFLYIEDVDLCTRLRVSGWTLAVVPQAVARHAAQHASHRSLQHLRWHIASMLRYWRSPGFRQRLRRRDPGRRSGPGGPTPSV
ncbi:MAG: glycosyltransferase family 2 protein [Burkholderiaceae bacterium]